MRCFATTSLALLSLRVASAFGEKFLYPTAGLTLHYLDTVNVEYQTTLYNPRLYTWCYNADNNIIQQRLDHPDGYDATASIQLNFTTGVRCWFNIRHNDTDLGFNSENWDFDHTQRSQTTLGLPTTTPTASATVNVPGSSASASVTTRATSSTSASATAAKSGSSSGLSTGAQAGIGAGIGIVGLVAGVAIATLLLRRQKRGKGSEKPVSNYPPVVPGDGNGNSPIYYSGSTYTSPLGADGQKFVNPLHQVGFNSSVQHEMDASPLVYELPSGTERIS